MKAPSSSSTWTPVTPTLRDCTISETLKRDSALTQNLTEDESVIRASPPASKDLISSDKSKILKTPTPTTKESPILEVGSIGNVKDCSPFWMQSCKEKYKKWWLPTETDLQDSEWSCWSTSSPKITPSSWFSKNLQTAKVAPTKKQIHRNCKKICLPSLPSSRPVITEKDLLPIENADKVKMATKKIRLFPDAQQRQMLLNWFGTARFVYNRFVQFGNTRIINKDGVEVKKNYKLARQHWVNNTGGGVKSQPWLLQCPRDVRDDAFRQHKTALSTEFKKKNQTGHSFHMRFKSRKDPSDSIYLNKRLIKRSDNHKISFYTSIMKTPIVTSEQLPPSFDHDCRLTRTRFGHYYLCIPLPMEDVTDNQVDIDKKGAVVSLDPGVRTFQTLYDPRGSVIQWGKDDYKHIMRYGKWMDKMQSKMDAKETLHGRRYRIRKALERMRIKLRNRIDECHKTLIHFLLTHYHHILLPSFESSQMTKRSSRRIGSKSVRSMMTWSHYRFKTRLLWKSQFYPSSIVHIVNESYTSMTCGQCGSLNPNLGSSKVFQCPNCNLIIDRDINGARNILLRNLSALA